jgi:hypothetical protein
MKKGKTSKIQGFKNAKVFYGTVDSIHLKSIYLNIQTWVEPKDDYENWNRIVSNLTRAIRHSIFESFDKSFFEEKFIVDLDLRSSGLTIGKKSFLNLEINLFFIEPQIDFKSKKIKDSLKNILKFIFKENLSNNKYFNFYLTKSNKSKTVLVES